MAPANRRDPGAAAVWPIDDRDGAAAPPGPWPLRLARRWIPGLLVAALVGWLVSPTAGVVIALVATLVAVTALTVPAVGRGFDRAVVAIGTFAGRLLTFVGLFAVFLVVFVPVGLVRRLVGADPLRFAPPLAASAWATRRKWLEHRLPTRSYASERDLAGSARRPRVLAAVGLVAVLVAVDLAVGTVVLDPPTAEAPAGVGTGGPEAIPALADQPEVTQLFTEIFSAGSGRYDPFLGWRLAPVEGDHLNVVDGERVSSRSTITGVEPIEVWFFGGSTMYGFGQRDEHTIPSEVVRLAEADGIAVEAHNFGTPAFNNWQATQLFAHLLTERPAPDVAVFYDGYNDISQQLIQGPHSEPTHALARSHQAAIEDENADVDRGDVRAWWADHSAVTNVIRRLTDRLDRSEEPELRLNESDSRVPADVDPDAVIAGTEAVLARGRSVAGALADRYDVELVHWWQPTLHTREAHPDEVPQYERAENRSAAWIPVSAALAERLPAEVVDLSDALDAVDEPIYWDTVHTNEEGAAVVAAAGYASLRETLLGIG